MIILLIAVLMDSTSGESGDSPNRPDGECLCINQVIVIFQYELIGAMYPYINCYYTVQSKVDDKNIVLIFCNMQRCWFLKYSTALKDQHIRS